MALRSLTKTKSAAGPGDAGTVVLEVRGDATLQALNLILQELQGIRAQLNDITELEN